MLLQGEPIIGSLNNKTFLAFSMGLIIKIWNFWREGGAGQDYFMSY